MAKYIDFDAVHMMKQVKIRITIKRFREWKIRLWIMFQLFKLAALVGNCNVEVEDENKMEANR